MLPRRSNVKQKSPPPLPTTSHPLLIKAPTTTENAGMQSLEKQRQNSSTAANNNIIVTPVHQSNASKQLNRSFSDAYNLMHARSGGRVKPRKSLESGLIMSYDSNTNSNMCNEPMPTTPTSRTVFLEQLILGDQTGGGGSTSDLSSCSNNNTRPLPAMGVTARTLGRKRLSNVSTDCFAIEKAVAHYQESTKSGSGCFNNNKSPINSPATTTSQEMYGSIKIQQQYYQNQNSNKPNFNKTDSPITF